MSLKSAKKRMAVLISGGGTNLQALIDAVEAEQISAEIAVVISDRAGAYGLQRAQKHGIENMVLSSKDFEKKSERDQAIVNTLKEHNVDFVMLAGYLSILTEIIVKKYEGRIINIHPALIPKYSGKGYYGDVIHEAVLNNKEKETGVTLHFVDTGVDSGPIIMQKKIQVEETDTLDTLKSRIHALEHKMIVETAKRYCEGQLVLDR